MVSLVSGTSKASDLAGGRGLECHCITYPEEASRSSWHNLLALHAVNCQKYKIDKMVSISRVEENVEVMWDVFGSEGDTAGAYLRLVGRVVFRISALF